MRESVSRLASDRRALGLRLRELRRSQGLTTRQLASRAGVSAALVSQIENARVDPSVQSLRRLALGLDIQFAYLFLEPEQLERQHLVARRGHATIVRRGLRKRLEVPESNLVYELLTPDLQGPIEFLWLTLGPAHPPSEPMSHQGYECAVVLEGILHLVIGGEDYVVETGDSVAFDSGIPHHIENRQDNNLVLLTAITPPSL